MSLVGCQSPQPKVVTPPAKTRAAVPQPFESPSFGIALTYPAGWSAQPDPKATADEVLHVVAPTGSAALALTVPKLPWHIPGMIPINLVASGFADDVRKRMADATGPAIETIPIPNAQARRVTLTGHPAGGRGVTEDAVLIVHGDRIYVLEADSIATDHALAAGALEAAVASIRWTK